MYYKKYMVELWPYSVKFKAPPTICKKGDGEIKFLFLRLILVHTGSVLSVLYQWSLISWSLPPCVFHSAPVAMDALFNIYLKLLIPLLGVHLGMFSHIFYLLGSKQDILIQGDVQYEKKRPKPKSTANFALHRVATCTHSLKSLRKWNTGLH